MTDLDNMHLTTRLGRPLDQEHIIKLSQRVQDNLTTSGSLQHIGPLASEAVAKAIANQKCFVLEHHPPGSIETNLVGCALSRDLEAGYFLSRPGFNMGDFTSPWVYLHSIMLEPEHQGRNIGTPFVSEVVEMIASTCLTERTLFLDCWAGNNKLRKFYSKIGFNFAAVIPEEDYEIAVFFRALHASNIVGAFD